MDPLRWPRDTIYPPKLALTSPTSGGRSIGIVRSRTKATEFSFLIVREQHSGKESVLRAVGSKPRNFKFSDSPHSGNRHGKKHCKEIPTPVAWS
jgi:hypothetical protein